MQSGIVFGFAGLVEYIVKKIKREFLLPQRYLRPCRHQPLLHYQPLNSDPS